MASSSDATTMGDNDIYDAEKIIKSRLVKKQRQYLIKWVGYPEPTWEPSRNIMDKRLIDAFKVRGRKQKSPSPSPPPPPQSTSTMTSQRFNSYPDFRECTFFYC